jgi:acyl transferase domain-containing protein/acyl carrier protein
MSDSSRPSSSLARDPIAVTGMSCRFPQAPSLDAFWRLLERGEDAISEVPADRFDVNDFYDPDPDAPGKMYVRSGGFIDHAFDFDPAFFGIAPREAISMDPQQRLLLEVSWEALEDAGEATDRLSGRNAGVFIGHSTNDYIRRSFGKEIDAYSGTGSATSIAAGRISYVFGLTGPNLPVDTACSSSLVALHLACQSLRNGECELALAAGVNLILAPESTVYFCKMRALSPDGRCKTFDALANGYVRGEGCGAIVLKPLSRAVVDGDRVYALIRGSAINQDGRSSGLTVPNRFAQEALLRRALVASGVAPHDVDYIEAHGTGTPLGDPIEIRAIAAVHTGRPTPLLVGSVKTNLGHLEAAAGIAGVIKTVLAIEKGCIPPHLHFHQPSPYIPWAEFPGSIPTTLTPWPARGAKPRMAGVSSFGFSGTNAHVVIEQAPDLPARSRTYDRPLHALCLSAKTRDALAAVATRMADRIATGRPEDFSDICYSANAGRSHFSDRVVVTATDAPEACAALREFACGNGSRALRSATVKSGLSPKVAFLFTGQGSQYVQMGRELYDSLPAFRRVLDDCHDLLQQRCGLALLDTLYPPDGASSPIDHTAYSQPALFALEYALARVWQGWGVQPASCAGHSIGELVAACIAGVFSLEDGLWLAAERGRLMQSLPAGGAMASIHAPGSVVESVLAGSGAPLSIAALNGPTSTVISGAAEAVEAAVAMLSRRGIAARRLTVSHAFHSLLMDPVLDELEELARQIDHQAPQVGLVSNVTGRMGGADDFVTARYWRRHAREPVLFADGVRSLDDRGYDVYLEIGPQPVLSTLARSCVPPREQLCVSSLRREGNAWGQMLHALGELHLRGVPVDWRAFDDGFERRHVSLPTYPFQRSRWALEPTVPAALPPAPRPAQPRLEDVEQYATYGVEWIPAVEPTSPEEPQPGRWLLFVDRAGVGASLASYLESKGSTCALVQPGDDFTSLGRDHWQVRAGTLDDFKRLLSEIEAGQPCAGIVHLWSLNAADADRLDGNSLAQAVRLGTGSVLHLIHALADRRRLEPPPVWLVTRDVQRVREDDAAGGIAQAPLWGMTRALAIEYPNLRCIRVDLEANAHAEQSVLDSTVSLVPLLRQRDGEDQVAVRAGRRYVPRLRRATAPDERPALDPSGTYLITGGVGGVGLLLARWLVENGARHLALVSRREPAEPARSAIAELERLNADVAVLQADIADGAETADLFARLARTMPPLKGIVHAAGVLEDGSFLNQEWSRFEKVMAPKVAGGWNVHVHTLGLSLDFVVFFSSLASLLGAATQSNYCAANAFLDALAHHRRSTGRPAVSINWGPWADTGMAARQQAATLRAWDMLGIGTLRPEDALSALGRLLRSAGPQFGVMKADWSKLVSLFPRGLEPPFLRDLVQGRRRHAPADEWAAVVRRVASASRDDAARAVRAFVEKLVSDVLGRPADAPFDPESGFFAMGMDSIMAVEFTARLRANLGEAHRLPVSFLFNHPNIGSVTDYLLNEALALPSSTAAPAPVVPPAADDGVAIVGYACCFPGAADENAFWELLCEGRDAIREVPADRWDVKRYYDPDPNAPGKMCVRAGGFLQDIDRFDAQFFGISPREAIKMDPQHRLLLETAWRALENAHHPPDRLKGTRTGVFVGISGNDYIRTIGESMDSGEVDAYFAPGNALSIAAGRLSYTFGFEGPCLAIDTACSSSLAAVHIACTSLRERKAHVALAGGVNVVLAPEINISLCKIGALAPDGRCKTFDASANGYVRSEGCGLVVLKRLDDARADGDRILAVIRSSSMNHDGRSSGLTVPNGAAQETLFREALAESGVSAGEIQYVEAHGTGTPLGDPIEMHSIASVYAQERDAERPLLVGSVKTNIGHLEAAAGIAGLIKVVQSLQHGRVPPHIHFRQPTPYIDWARTAVRIPTRLEDWPPGRRLAAVSSFGFSGTNVHCIVEGPLPDFPVPVDEASRPLHLLCLSARSQPALVEQARRTAAALKNHRQEEFADACFSLNAGRTHFAQRAFVVARSFAEAVAQIESLADGRHADVVRRSPAGAPKIAFLFTGDGCQYSGMGRQLFETQPTFRRAIEEGAAAAEGVLEKSLVAALYPARGRRSLVNHSLYAQPALFVLQYALVRLWQSWGIRPSIVAGHSLGECAAACAAGVFSVESGVKLVAERARIMRNAVRSGGMLAVSADLATVTEVLRPYGDALGVAAVNSPLSTVVSGLLEPLSGLSNDLERRGIRAKNLKVAHAFHSSLLEALADDFMRVASGIEYAQPTLPIVSTITGVVDDGTLSKPEYWARQLREPVRFMSSLNTLAETGCNVFVEIGPHPTLTTLAQQTLPSAEAGRVWLHSLRRRSDDWREMLSTLGQLYLRGADCDWKGFDADYRRHWVPVPNYAFQKERFWPAASALARVDTAREPRAVRTEADDLLLGRRLRSPALHETVFENRFSADHPSFLADHKIFSMVVVPGACHLAMAFAAASHLGGDGRIAVADVAFPEGMILPAGESRLIQLVLSPPQQGAHEFRVVSAKDDDAPVWLVHCTGRLIKADAGLASSSGAPARDPDDRAGQGESIREIQERCPDHLPSTQMFYRLLAQHGIELGANFQWIQEIWRRPGEAVARLRPARPEDRLGADRLHPGWIDACFQLLTAALTKTPADFATHLPISVERFVWYSRPETSSWIHVRLREPQHADDGSFEADIDIRSETGAVVAAIDRYRVRRAPKETLSRFAQRDITDALYRLQWTRVDAPLAQPAQLDGTWLVFERSEARRSALVSLVESMGGRCITIEPGAAFERCGDRAYRIVPTSADHFRDLMRDVLGPERPELRGVVHAWSCREPQGAPHDELSAVLDDQQYGTQSVLALVQALVSMRATRPPRLWIATSGVQPVAGRENGVDITASPVWGLARVIALEHPPLRCTRIDLDPGLAESTQGETLFREVASDEAEDQVAYSGNTRFVARLSRYRVSASASDNELQLPRNTPFRLVRAAHGALSEITAEITQRHAPGQGEIELQPAASALNFRDVLNALGLYPAGTSTMGWEAAGVITAVGPGVSHVSVGDEVIALAPGSFAKLVTTDARLAVARPSNVGIAAAAGIPVVFLTAHYALRELARVRRDDKVLVHAAAGGVGLAAVQIARSAGATVLATAGSVEKREYLKQHGIEHVFDSRSLAFADEIRTATAGAGVDVVLNSLPGEYVARNLALLAEGGRFVEIGKLGTWTPEQVSAVRPDVQYFLFALDTLVFENTNDVAAKLSLLVRQFADGELEPLPHTLFPMRNAKDAFRYMAQAKHIGKVILDHDSGAAGADAASISLRDDATYLITGGLGGLGLGLCEWLVDQGVRYLALVSRRAPGVKAAETLRGLESRGAHIVALCADVSVEEELRAAIERIARDLPPLKGVFHAAGVLADGILVNLKWSDFLAVMAPKVLGAVLLDRLTRQTDLDFFVMFSSAASLLGSPGQGNYAAANSFLDAFAHYRQAQGRPGQSINWGAWDEVGMTVSSKRPWQGLGLHTIKKDQGFETFGVLLREKSPQVAVLPIEWSQVVQHFPNGEPPAILAGLAREFVGSLEPSPEWTELRQRVAAAPPAERKALVLERLLEIGRAVLGLAPNRFLDPTVPLNELGFDSLMAVELAKALGRAAGLPLSVTLLFDYPTFDKLAGYLLSDVLQLAPAIHSAPPAFPDGADIEFLPPRRLVERGLQPPRDDDSH